ncbi:Cof-type HAD-IIB family hydrolase [Mollicutes bacterium LVI A0039]|nr:Cof-type HAD-IIB family hydrolase [Mollicutes bacterium LVI A0039]
MFKYIALDFDGTLLGVDHKISDRSVAVLKKLQEKGIVVILCSGRNVTQMDFVAAKIGTEKYETFIISDNGGVVTEVKDGKRTVLRNAKFRDNELAEILKLVHRRTKVISAFNDGKRYLAKFYLFEMLRAYFRFKERSIIGLPNQASKILLIDTREKIEKVYEETKNDILNEFPHLNVFRSVPTLIEVTPEGSTKGQGLELVFEKQGWDLKDLIVFGDGENDISMFEVAGRSVAMANGFDTVKACSDEVCLANSEDGVAKYLEQYYESIL